MSLNISVRVTPTVEIVCFLHAFLMCLAPRASVWSWCQKRHWASRTFQVLQHSHTWPGSEVLVTWCVCLCAFVLGDCGIKASGAYMAGNQISRCCEYIRYKSFFLPRENERVVGPPIVTSQIDLVCSYSGDQLPPSKLWDGTVCECISVYRFAAFCNTLL